MPGAALGTRPNSHLSTMRIGGGSRGRSGNWQDLTLSPILRVLPTLAAGPTQSVATKTLCRNFLHFVETFYTLSEAKSGRFGNVLI